MFVERVHLRTSEKRGGSRRTIFAIGPEASASLRAHPVASSTQRSASDHEVPSRIFANRSTTMIPSAFSSRTSPDQSAAASGFTSDAVRFRFAFANVVRIARRVGTRSPRTGTGEPRYETGSGGVGERGAFRICSTRWARAAPVLTGIVGEDVRCGIKLTAYSVQLHASAPAGFVEFVNQKRDKSRKACV